MTEPAPLAPLLLSAGEAASRLNVSDRHLWSHTAPRGPIRAVRIGGRVLYPVAEIAGLIDAPAAARVLGICETTLRTASAEGTIPSLMIGRRRLWSVAALEQWIAAATGQGADT